MFVRVAKKNKQTAHNTPHLDDEVEEDEETESFAALEGEALVITSPLWYILLIKIIHQLQEEESDLPAEQNLRKHAVQQQKSLQEKLLERLFLPKHLVSHHYQFRKDTMH